MKPLAGNSRTRKVLAVTLLSLTGAYVIASSLSMGRRTVTSADRVIDNYAVQYRMSLSNITGQHIATATSSGGDSSTSGHENHALEKAQSFRPDGNATAPYPEHAQICESRKILFIHIPKSGGSTFEQSFLFARQRKRTHKLIGGHYKIAEFDRGFIESYHKFCMVRHPCSRLLSAWAYLVSARGNRRDKKWVRENLSESAKSSFTSFVKATFVPEGHVTTQDENHLQSQVGMIFQQDGTFGLNQMLVYEKWRESVDALGARIDTDVSALKRSHKRRGHHATCEEAYTPETWAKMIKLYEMDFCVLGYSTDVALTDISPPLNLTEEYLTTQYRICAEKLTLSEPVL